MKESSAQEILEASKEPELKPAKFKPKKEKIKKIKKPRFIKLKAFISKNGQRIKFVKDFIFYIVIYGIPITYMFWAFIMCESYWLKIPAFGIAFYLLKEELPIIWRKLFSARK